MPFLDRRWLANSLLSLEKTQPKTRVLIHSQAVSCLLTGILAFFHGIRPSGVLVPPLSFPQEAIVNATDRITSYESFISVS